MSIVHMNCYDLLMVNIRIYYRNPEHFMTVIGELSNVGHMGNALPACR
jgi:hypothetical protein